MTLSVKVRVFCINKSKINDCIHKKQPNILTCDGITDIMNIVNKVTVEKEDYENV